MITFKWISKNGVSGGTFLANIKDGVTYSDNLSEDLDSATIILEYQDKLNFEPFDIVELWLPMGAGLAPDEQPAKTMIINDFVEIDTIIDATHRKYQYTINLMSKTKELERVTLPSFSITKMSGQNAKTIRQVITELLEDYSPKYYDTNGVLQQRYTIVSSPRASWNTPCPDMQMTKPTLRAAIDRILSVVNEICVLYGGNIVSSLNLNERNNEITLDNRYNYRPENQSGNDYADSLENNYQNVVPNQDDNFRNYTDVTDYIGFRSENDMLVNDENAVLLTQNPIYNLKKVLFCGKLKMNNDGEGENYLRVYYNDGITNTHWDVQLGSAGLNSDHYFEIDITDYIKEEQEYNISLYEDQKTYGYYSRGNKNIEGLLKFKKTKIEDYITLVNMIASVLSYNAKDIFVGDIFSNTVQSIETQIGRSIDVSYIRKVEMVNITNHEDYDLSPSNLVLCSNNKKIFENAMFRIEYQSQVEDLRTKSGKYLRETNQDNTIVDNPSEAYVDIKRQGELFSQKCNRLGNRVKEIQAIFDIDADYPQLGDYIGDYVLMHREIQVYDDYILFKGILTENFVNINYFTGINARKRTYNVIPAGEAFDKELLEKFYLEFSWSRTEAVYRSSITNYFKTPTTNYQRLKSLIVQVGSIFNNDFLSNFKNQFGHALLSNTWTDYNTHYYDQPVSYIELDLSTYITGNSLVLHCKVDDNMSAGISINDTAGQSYPVEKYNKYTDDNGFANVFVIDIIYKSYPSTWGYMPTLWSLKGDVISDSDWNATHGYRFMTHMKPRLYVPDPYAMLNTFLVFGLPFQNHKDSREKLGFNIQFEYCSANKNIIVGNGLFERNYAGFNYYKIYASTEEYKVSDKKLKAGGTHINGTITTTQVDEQCMRFDITNLASFAGRKSLAITDGNDNLILALNTTAAAPEFYLNLLKIRDKKRYLSNNLKTWQ